MGSPCCSYHRRHRISCTPGACQVAPPPPLVCTLCIKRAPFSPSRALRSTYTHGHHIVMSRLGSGYMYGSPISALSTADEPDGDCMLLTLRQFLEGVQGQGLSPHMDPPRGLLQHNLLRWGTGSPSQDSKTYQPGVQVQSKQAHTTQALLCQTQKPWRTSRPQRGRPERSRGVIALPWGFLLGLWVA